MNLRGSPNEDTPSIWDLRWSALLVLVSIGTFGCAGGDRRTLPPGAQRIGAPVSEPEKLLSLGRIGGFLGAGYLFIQEDHTDSSIERTEHLFQERAGIGVDGTIFSPNFLRYEGSGVLGISQDHAENRTESEFDTGELYEAEVSAHLFPRRFHPADLYFGRFEEIRPQVFFSSFETTTTIARASQHFRFKDLNLRFDADHRETDQETFGIEASPFLNVVEDTFGASGKYSITERQSVSASYNYQDVKQEISENSFTAHNLLATHRLFLDSDKDHNLRSRLETKHQDGSLDQELLRWTETLNSRILDSLDGDLEFLLENNQTNLLDLEILRGEGGLRHQLYESLTSSLRLYGEQLKTEGNGTNDIFGGAISFNYRKKTGLGVLRFSYMNSLERRIAEADSSGAIDEQHTFPAAPPEEVQLAQVNIDLASVVVTDPSGLIFYRLGLDYTLFQDTAGLTTITRIFSGIIPIGGTILVDYTFETASDFTLDSMNQNLRLEHEFHGGLAPYFMFQRQDQYLRDVEGAGAIVPVRERSLIGGLEWRGQWFLLGGEYENRESTVLPFDAVRLRAQASTEILKRQMVSLNANQAWLFYNEPERDVSISQGSLRWTSTLGQRAALNLDAAVHYTDDSLQGESFGFSISGVLDYTWRKMIIRLQASHRETRGVTSDFRGEVIGIWIVREFGKPPPSTTRAIDRFFLR